MCEFFDKDGNEIYDKEEFVNYYKDFYYTDSASMLAGTRRQCSRYVEEIIDNLLKKGIQNQRDVMHILAWKLARVDHKNANSYFKYQGAWEALNELEDVDEKDIDTKFNNMKFQLDDSHGRKLDTVEIKKLANDIVKYCNNPNYIKLLSDKNNEEELRNLIERSKYKNPMYIGPVYQITLLYFMSKGEYPIYDQFADKALNAILSGKKPGELVLPLTKLPQKGSGNFEKRLMAELKSDDNIITDKKYMAYKKRIELVFGDYEENYRAGRDIDRALWVYGHLFNSTYIKYSSVWDWFLNWYLDISEKRLSTKNDIVIYTQPYEDEDTCPVYRINIDLTDTKWEDKPFETVTAWQPLHDFKDNTHEGWECSKDGSMFTAYTKLLSLKNVLEIFREWIESD